MEYLTEVKTRKNTILCCECGTPIEPNPSNMCVACLRSHVDITEGIPKQATLHFCSGCERYLQPPSEWVHCVLESRELLSLCLKRLKGLNRVKLVDAGFVWTEPHSKRIKVKLTVHGEVAEGTVLQQVFVVEYTVSHQMCDDCHRAEAKDYWRASVQVRQKAENKKTFYYLEQLMLKYKAHENTLGIKPVSGGLDFFYSTEANARKMVDFIGSVLPVKHQHSKKLISHDIHSNVYNYKFTYSVEIVPISKDSVVCLSKKMSQQLGGISPIALVYRVTNSIHLIDPATCQIADVSGPVFWRTPFKSICDPKQLEEYIVMDIDTYRFEDMKTFPGQGAMSKKHIPADVWVCKASELGTCSEPIHTRTHLGHILKHGDSVLGYNLADTNVNDDNFEKLDKSKVQDIILVKKYYGAGKRNRPWKLKHLSDEATGLKQENDYDDFLKDLEEDPDLRKNVNIYKNPQAIPVDADDHQTDDGYPHVTLEEMLNDLVIGDDVEMAE